MTSILLLIILLSFWCNQYEIKNLKRKIQKQEEQINQLCNCTGNESLSSRYISEQLKRSIYDLKKQGKEVEAVKKIRQETELSLLEAKQYVDQIEI